MTLATLVIAGALAGLFFVLPLPMWLCIVPAVMAVVWWERCVEAGLVLMTLCSSWAVFSIRIPGLFSNARLPMVIVPAITIITGLGIMVRLTRNSRLKVFNAGTDVPVIVFLTLTLASSVVAWSSQRPPAMFKAYILSLALYLTCFGAYWTTACLVRSKREEGQCLLKLLIIALFLSAAPVAVMEFIGLGEAGGEVKYGQDIDGFLGGGFLGCYWVLVLSVAIGLLIKMRSVVIRAALAVVIAAGTAGLVIPYARAAWVGMGVAFTTILFRLKKTYCAMFLAACCLFLLWNPVWEAMLDTFTNRKIEGTYSRLRLWSAGIEIIRENPVIGVGPGNFGIFSSASRGPVRSSHNNYIEFAVESGVLAPIAIAAFLIVVWFAVSRVSNSHESPLISGTALGIVGALTGIAAASAFGDFLLPVRSNAGYVSISGSIYLWIFLGFVVGIRCRMRDKSDMPLAEKAAGQEEAGPQSQSDWEE